MSQHSFHDYQPSPEANEPGLTVRESTTDAPSTAEYYLNLGNRHYNNYLTRAQNQDLTRAIEHYGHALEMNPNLAEGYVKLASALWDQGSITLEIAIQHCKTALAINPANTEAHLFLGYFLRHAGNTEEAMNHFRQAITKNPLKSAKPRLALGRTLINKASQSENLSPLGRLAYTTQGLAQFALGCSLLPLDTRTFSALQSALVMDLKISSVIGLGKSLQALGQRKATIRLYDWASQQLCDEPIFFHLLGDLYTGQNEPSAAIYYYNRAQELDPDNLTLYKKLGGVYALCNDNNNAAKSLEKVVEQDAEDFDTLYSLAQIQTDRGDYMRALYYFKELAKRSPNNPYIHSNMAYVLFKLEDHDGALSEYKKAVKYGEDPIWTATVAQTMGTIYYQVKKDVDAAMEMFQMAYKLDASNLECIAMLADLHIDRGNLEAAISAYRYILTFEPDNAECHNYIGYLLWQMDQNEEAIEAYQKALQYDPDNYIAYNNLGVIHLDEQANPAKALGLFQRALYLKPDYTLACFNIGRAQESLGHTTDAAKTYSEALALNAENEELTNEEILERLDQLFRA